MHVPTLIEKKRDGQELTAEEIADLVSGFNAGAVPDYQMSAWTMAVVFQGMTAAETQHLATAMKESGSVLEYPAGSPPKVDKHSTGGIGDKTSLVLAPLLACDENWVPMICGRGLGITGGTLDKLESIPGFNIHIDERRATRPAQEHWRFYDRAKRRLCPADKKLYALRDVTGTVPLPAVNRCQHHEQKTRGKPRSPRARCEIRQRRFMKTRKEAQKLAAAMTEVGNLMGVKVTHLLSPMDEPLGRTVGNALEVIECVEILQGGGPDDVVKLVLDLAEQVSNGTAPAAAQWLKDGTAWKKFISLVYAQDGDASSLEKLGEVHRAPVVQPLPAKAAGTVKKMDAETYRPCFAPARRRPANRR